MKKHLKYPAVLALSMFALGTPTVDASGSYLFAGASRRETVTHPMGYTGGNNQHLIITVGIRPDSTFRDEMENATINAINTWNRLEGIMPNVFTGSNTGVPTSHYDYESVLVHELGHALGFGHVNLASESGLPKAQQGHTKSTTGANGVFNVSSGADGIPGTKLDVRGDDLPMVWFHKETNDPFANPPVVDKSTYSMNLSDLPAGSLFPASGSTPLSTLLGHPESEVVMHQGAVSRQVHRELSPGCVAAMRLSMAGFDRTAGTNDDYTYELRYVGITTNAQIRIGYDNSKTAFAATYVGASSAAPNNYVVNSGDVYFNSTYKWYFNQLSNAVLPPVTPPPVEISNVMFIY